MLRFTGTQHTAVFVRLSTHSSFCWLSLALLKGRLTSSNMQAVSAGGMNVGYTFRMRADLVQLSLINIFDAAGLLP